MRSIFSKIFYSVLLSSLLVLASMLLFSLLGVQASINNWNRDKTKELEALLTPILSKVYRLNGGLNEKNLENALSPYMTDSLYVYVYNDEKTPLFAVNQGTRLSLTGPNNVQPSLDQASVVEIKDGEDTIAFLAAANVDFFTYEANREFISTIARAAFAGAVITILLALVMSTLFSLPFSRQTKEVINGLTQLGLGERQVSFSRSFTLELNKIAESANKLQMQLIQEENLRRQWMQDISHDLRTPLTAIKAQFEAMIDGVLDSSKERLSSLLSEMNRMEDLVNNLQELSRYESPETRIHPKKIEVETFLNEMRERFSFLASQKNILFDCTGTSDFFSADDQLIKRCVSNILQNAIQYTEPGGSVYLSIKTEDAATRISVDNTGHISEQDMPHLFDRLYRGNSSRSGKGSGLGLSIAKAIVDLHGGSLVAENRDADVHFELHLAKPAELSA